MYNTKLINDWSLFMSNNYFNIERGNKCHEFMFMVDIDNNQKFQDVMDMSYEEIKNYDEIEDFVYSVMDASNALFESSDEQTLINLVNGEDDVFIWGILIGPDEDSDKLRYAFIDWHKDGKSYRYKKD